MHVVSYPALQHAQARQQNQVRPRDLDRLPETEL